MRPRTGETLLAALGLVALFCASNWAIPGPGHEPTAVAIAVSGLLFALALSLNVVALIPSLRSSPDV